MNGSTPVRLRVAILGGMAALLLAPLVGCGEGPKSTDAAFAVDVTPAALANTEFNGVVIVAPIADRGSFLGISRDPEERSAKFLVTDAEAYVIPEAHIERLTALPVGEVISVPKSLYGTWARVRDIYGEPAETDLVKNLSLKVKPNEHGLRVMEVSSGPLASENVTRYVGRAAAGQEIVVATAAAPPAEEPYTPKTPKTRLPEVSFSGDFTASAR